MSIYNIILEMYLSSRNLCMNIVVMLYGAVICISNGTFICIKNLYQVVSIYLYCIVATYAETIKNSCREGCGTNTLER